MVKPAIVTESPGAAMVIKLEDVHAAHESLCGVQESDPRVVSALATWSNKSALQEGGTPGYLQGVPCEFTPPGSSRRYLGVPMDDKGDTEVMFVVVMAGDELWTHNASYFPGVGPLVMVPVKKEWLEPRMDLDQKIGGVPPHPLAESFAAERQKLLDGL